MPVISKELFYKKIPHNVTCDVLHYWDENCFKAMLTFAPTIFLGTAKFFLPIYIVKALLNYKKLKNRKFLKDLAVSELRSACYGVTMFSLMIGSLCFLRKLTGRIHYYNIGFLPGIMGCLSLMVESRENRILDRIIFFNMIVEAFFINMNYFKILNLTATKETVIFMATSCVLMHTLANQRNDIDYLHFWFYTPAKVREMNAQDKHKCLHDTDCQEFLVEGALKYFGIGYLVNIIRLFIPKLSKLPKKPSILLDVLFNLKNVSFGVMLGGYVAIFRLFSCLLWKSGKIPEKYHSAISGFFSGITYLISPNLQLLVIAVTTLLQASYQAFTDKIQIKIDSEIPAQALFMLCGGILLHNRVFCPETCPAYFSNMCNLCSSNRFDEMYKKIMFLIF